MSLSLFLSPFSLSKISENCPQVKIKQFIGTRPCLFKYLSYLNIMCSFLFYETAETNTYNREYRNCKDSNVYFSVLYGKYLQILIFLFQYSYPILLILLILFSSPEDIRVFIDFRERGRWRGKGRGGERGRENIHQVPPVGNPNENQTHNLGIL